MKRAIIECDLCHKELDEKTSIFGTVFINENGLVTRRVDVCEECLVKTLNLSTEKGGVE